MARLPILMYHKVCKNEADATGLTISEKKLEAQFQYLIKNKYKPYHFEELKDTDKINKKSVIITFDDVYVNQLTYAYPLLKKYGLKACFYIPFKYVGDNDSWNKESEQLMDLQQLKSLDPNVVEFGFHSYEHKAYNLLSVEDIENDFKKCHDFIETNQLNVSNVLAYPYGKFPKKGEANTNFETILKKNKIEYGLRIGNRINKFPFKNNYQIQRIDVKGEDSINKFVRKLKFGSKLF